MQKADVGYTRYTGFDVTLQLKPYRLAIPKTATGEGNMINCPFIYVLPLFDATLVKVERIVFMKLVLYRKGATGIDVYINQFSMIDRKWSWFFLSERDGFLVFPAAAAVAVAKEVYGRWAEMWDWFGDVFD